MPEETTIHQDQTVTITSHRAIFSGTMYPIHQITSVSVEKQPPSPFVPMMLIIIGGFMALYAFTDLPEKITSLLLGIALAGGGIALGRNMKPNYVLQLTTSAGQVSAIESLDAAYIEKLQTALSQAIVK